MIKQSYILALEMSFVTQKYSKLKIKTSAQKIIYITTHLLRVYISWEWWIIALLYLQAQSV